MRRRSPPAQLLVAIIHEEVLDQDQQKRVELAASTERAQPRVIPFDEFHVDEGLEVFGLIVSEIVPPPDGMRDPPQEVEP